MDFSQLKNKVHVRWMIRRDMDEVLAIDAKNGLQWTEEDFLRNLRQRNCIGMVAELGDEVVGYMIYDLHKWNLDILNLAVKRQNEGVGTELIARLASKLSSHRRTAITLTVNETNLNALRFLQRKGFIGSLRRREFGSRDGILMTFRLPVDANSNREVEQSVSD